MILNLEGEARKIGKKSDLNNMRKAGLIPAVIYAEGNVGLNVTIPANDFKKAYKKSIGELAIFNLTIDGKEYHTVVKEKQIHPVSREVVHIDFLELHKEQELTIKVPIKFVGTPLSLKEGGLLDVMKRQMEVHCLPGFIPEDVELNIENLKIGETVYCKDIKIPNVKILDHADLAIVTVHGAKAGSETSE